MSEQFSLKKFIAGFADGVGWAKEVKTIVCVALIGIFVYMVWFTFFRKEPRNVSNQRVTVTPFAKVDKIDQSSIQVMVEEKKWEAGMGVGVIQYDNKSGAFAGVMVKRKW